MNLVCYSPWGRKESDTTEQLHFHFLLSYIGEGNGNPLEYSCLENPRDRRARWAAIYGVTQSQTQLKQLSSSSSTKIANFCALKNINKKVNKSVFSIELKKILYIINMSLRYTKNSTDQRYKNKHTI